MNRHILDNQLLTPEQVSEILSIPRATLYAWRTRGKGPAAIKIGKHLRYRQGELDAWLLRQENE